MSDLLKEAIADAKAVRETALENAKMALEEAFTPHLKSMLSAKLSEEDVEEGMHDDDPRREDDDEEKDEGMHDKPRREDDDEEKEEGMKPRRDDDDEDMEEGMHDDEDEKEEADEGIIEINGVKYARLEGAHEDEEEDPDEELDLESVIKELETEIAESEESDDDLTEGDDEEDDKKDESVNEEEELDEEEEIDEQSKSSGIGAGDNKVTYASSSDEEDPGKGKIKAESLQTELKEYKEAVTYLREKLHEVNILNAKLLYTNRLFKEYVLSNDQKMKVVETFDRAQTTREIKLVYSTLAESFNDRGEINKKRGVKESASRKTNTTKPQTKIISEEDNVANRFKKLAGILKD